MEVNDAASLITSAVHPEANIIFGAGFDDTLGDEIRITVIATGYADAKQDRAAEPIFSQPRATAGSARQASDGLNMPNFMNPPQSVRPAAPAQQAQPSNPAPQQAPRQAPQTDDNGLPSFIRRHK